MNNITNLKKKIRKLLPFIDVVSHIILFTRCH